MFILVFKYYFRYLCLFTIWYFKYEKPNTLQNLSHISVMCAACLHHLIFHKRFQLNTAKFLMSKR